MLLREHYLQQLRPFYDTDLIKIITGIRRSGKSVILQQAQAELQNAGHPTLTLNFEDLSVLGEVKNGQGLVKFVLSRLGGEKLFVFLDEVQSLSGWAEAVRSLRLHNLSLFVTGSNSKLLSREFVKEFSGRYVSVRIRPFVYTELMQYARQLGREISIGDYLVWGGFPKRLEFPAPEAQKLYLQDLQNTIVYNDLITRYGIRRLDLFRRMVTFVLKNNARIFSVKSIHDYIRSENVSCSINTVIKYLEYLKEAYIVNSLPQYSKKNKRELAFYQKLYNEDVAFNSLNSFGEHYDVTHNLENVVYNELLYRGYDLRVYVDGKHEIDFFAEKDGLRYYIQVAYSVAEVKTYEREMAPFARLNNLAKKILITNDEIDYSTSTVQHLKLKDFLVRDFV